MVRMLIMQLGRYHWILTCSGTPDGIMSLHIAEHKNFP